jgi:hypothetical protein
VKWRPASAWATVSLLASILALPGAAGAAETPGVVQLRDARISEASSLVDLGSMWVTSYAGADVWRFKP